MKISLNKGNLSLNTKAYKILIGESIKKIPQDYNLIISQKELFDIIDFKGEIIDSPGEYEYFDTMVQALPSKNSAAISLFSIDIDAINVIYISSSFQWPSKKMMDQLGVNHILVINGEMSSANIQSIIDEFSPQILIPLGWKEAEIESFSKKMGLVIPSEKQKTLTIDREDFADEEESQMLRLCLLDN